MLIRILSAGGLVVTTVAVHAAGFAALIRVLMRTNALDATGFLHLFRVVIGLTCCLILIHLIEIAVWGCFYQSQGCLPDAESAFYFSAVTYTTVGYGEVVLAKPWRTLAPIESLVGILMCGVSTGLFFAIVSRWISHWVLSKSASRNCEAGDGGNHNTTED